MTRLQHNTTCPSTSKPCLYHGNVSKNANVLADRLHCVIAYKDGKFPIAPGWRERPATAAEIEAALLDPDLVIGHIPAAAGLLVVDIDVDRGLPVGDWAEAVEDSLGPAACTVRSRSGGLHLYYRCDQPVGDLCWEGGEVRCGSGHAVLWDVDAVLGLLEGLDEHEPVDTDLWPLQRHEAPPPPFVEPEDGQTGKVWSALRHVPCAKVHYDDWIAVGHALHWGDAVGHIEDGLKLWIRWSRTDPARYVPGECVRKWCGFDASRGRTIRTLFGIAKLHGWVWWGNETPDPAVTDAPDVPDHPDLNDRQRELHNWYYAQARHDGRRGGILHVSIENRHLAAFLGCSRKTVERDTAHMVTRGYLRPDGWRHVTTPEGGYRTRVWRPTTPYLQMFLTVLERQAENPPEPATGCTVRLDDGGVADILPPLPGVVGVGWLPLLVLREGRAPP